MLKLGEKQTLTVVKQTDFGWYLSDTPKGEERVLLPAGQAPEGTALGDEIPVFLYKDSRDRLISTVREPKLTLGQTAVLKVKETGKIGAFLDWGLEKDLLLPFKEQTFRVKEGDECLVTLYTDKSDRLCASMKVYHVLSTRSPYQIGDEVSGRVYEVSRNFGVFVAVDDRYSGLIPAREAPVGLNPGDMIRARVTGVKEDGKLDLSVRRKAYLQMDDDAALVMEKVDACGGALPFDDHASPDQIRQELGLTKNAFKRAVGRLLKQGQVEIADGSIRRKKK